LMYPGGGHRCRTGLSGVSWFFTLPRSGIEDSREFQYSQIPGKSFVFLPSLSSLPPERSLKATNGRETNLLEKEDLGNRLSRFDFYSFFS